MNKYAFITRNLQSKLSRRAFQIQKEEVFKQFYKECGRTKEARSSKLRLKELHAEQSIEKYTLKVVQGLAYQSSYVDTWGL